MKVLVACEFSGITRNAFTALGHEAVSCDFLPSDLPGNHYQGNVLDIINDGWDLMIAHPPCTHLAVSGARWFKEKEEVQLEAIEFAKKLYMAPIHKIAIENPKSILSSVFGKPTQIVQPWQFGHIEVKGICLWLKNLPKLKPTNITTGRFAFCHLEGASKFRSKRRSVSFTGIASAMASQWTVV